MRTSVPGEAVRLRVIPKRRSDLPLFGIVRKPLPAVQADDVTVALGSPAMPHRRHGAGEVFVSALKEPAENAGEH